MIYEELGKSKISVSKLCFGALTIGPLQAGLSILQGAEVLRHALNMGVNFVDTAEIYGTYPYIRQALKGFSGTVVIASKSYAYTAKGMRESLEKARFEMDRDVIDIFLLHEQENALTIQGHGPALEYLLEAKSRGLVKAIGISTHTVAAVKASLEKPEIEIIHPLINLRGIGILDGNREDMLTVISKAHQQGKGIYGMKPIAGGNLISQAREALSYAFSLPVLHSVAVGMKSRLEVEFNVALAERREPDLDTCLTLGKEDRRLHIEEWCQGCGQCIEACPQGALTVVDSCPHNSQDTSQESWELKKMVRVETEKCILCGYCGARCPDFCIKIV
jgi:aryl-alcohol dehydrogenase-like predicted oxidoreductase